MTRFFEHKRPDQDTITTQLHRTHLFTSNHPTLTQIVRRNDVITDLYALGTETERSTEQRRIYPNTVYGHAPPQNAQPLTYFEPFTEQSFKRIKAPYHNDIVSTFGHGPKQQRTYHVILENQITAYYEDDEALRPAD